MKNQTTFAGPSVGSGRASSSHRDVSAVRFGFRSLNSEPKHPTKQRDLAVAGRRFRHECQIGTPAWRNQRAPDGGTSKRSHPQVTRTRGPLTRRFFSAAWGFCDFKGNQNNQTPRFFSHLDSLARSGQSFYFPVTPGGVKSLARDDADRWSVTQIFPRNCENLFLAPPRSRISGLGGRRHGGIPFSWTVPLRTRAPK
jgi:hypothetical protein